MDIIPIQASSVPCERVFSSGKETMAPRRRRIKPVFMEKLQMLKYAIRKDTYLNFTQGMAWDAELAEVESIQKNSIPNEVFSYMKYLETRDDEDEDEWEDESVVVEEGEDIFDEGDGEGDVEDDSDDLYDWLHSLVYFYCNTTFMSMYFYCNTTFMSMYFYCNTTFMSDLYVRVLLL